MFGSDGTEPGYPGKISSPEMTRGDWASIIVPRKPGECPCDPKHEKHEEYVKKKPFDKFKAIWSIEPDLFYVKFSDTDELMSLYNCGNEIFENSKDAKERAKYILKDIIKFLNSKAEVVQLGITELTTAKSSLSNAKFSGNTTVNEQIELQKNEYEEYLSCIKTFRIHVPKKLMCKRCGSDNNVYFVLERYFPKLYKKWKEKDKGFDICI